MQILRMKHEAPGPKSSTPEENQPSLQELIEKSKRLRQDSKRLQSEIEALEKQIAILARERPQ